jgi:flavorubredoxin
MHNVYEISPKVFWIGGNDRRIERFENMFPLPNGVAYNSYLILDDKTAIIDTVDSSISALYLENITRLLGERSLDYLIINHMEPDHCANIEELARRYPDVKIIGNQKTFQFMEQYYSLDMSSKYLEIKDGSELDLGSHTLRFYMAPMVHWPEVMFTYEVSQGILFSADAFGSFGAMAGNLFVDEVEYDNAFLDEARRYYTNIVGRYGSQVQGVFKKLSNLTINMICSLHGLIWRGDDVAYIFEKYNLWSKYLPEKKGVVLVYASMYGNTENAMNALAMKLSQRGVKDMRMYDISKTHPSYIISDIFKYSNIVIGSCTYNMHLYFPMDSLLRELAVLNMKDRKVAILGNHTWASAAVKNITELLGAMKGMEIIGTPLDIRSTLRTSQEETLNELADAICASLTE